jgi:hypothetical protein
MVVSMRVASPRTLRCGSCLRQEAEVLIQYMYLDGLLSVALVRTICVEVLGITLMDVWYSSNAHVVSPFAGKAEVKSRSTSAMTRHVAHRPPEHLMPA